MSLLRSLLAASPSASRSTDLALTFGQALEMMKFGGLNYGLSGNQTLVSASEDIGSSFQGYVDGAMKSNGVVFACIVARMLLFSEARFQYQRMRAGRPGDLFATRELDILETPWPNGTTGDLLSRALQDADLAGNSYTARLSKDRLTRMRPDWVSIMLGSKRADWRPGDPDTEVAGYLYHPGGPAAQRDPITFLPADVAHFAPIPDPTATYRGMSWLTPIVREIMADKAAMDHKLKFFEHGATVNLVVKMDPTVKAEAFDRWVAKFKDEHESAMSAYRTLFLGGGADVKAIGADMKQIDFKTVQGHGEPLAVDTPVPTPTGWTTMGAIKAGDEVFGRDGRAAAVVGVSPVHGGRACYRVTFSDKTSIVADEGHLWCVIDRNSSGPDGRPESTQATSDLIAGMVEWSRRGNGGNRYGIPAGAPCQTAGIDLLVDPYVLGVWLGDGATAGAAVCGAEPDLSFIAAEIERRGYTVRRWNTAPSKVPVIGLPGGLLSALDALGVLGDKHIPAEYLRASLTQRLDLLRGLMDTDGTIGHVGNETCEFSSKWEHLARQMAELTRSLGYRVTVGEKKDARSRTGATWRVTFRADPDVVPFLLARKADRCQTPVWVKNRAIVAIEPVASVPVRCIAVDAEDHLFRAGEGWTLTHNTRIAAAAGVPPIIVGLSEGLEAATYSNYGQARRRFADGTMRPLWRSMAGALASIVAVPADARLWYDDRDIPFLQEDVKDAADIQQTQAISIKQLVEAGFTPDSVIDATVANDLGRLKHTGMFSVQLQEPGTQPSSSAALVGENGRRLLEQFVAARC